MKTVNETKRQLRRQGRLTQEREDRIDEAGVDFLLKMVQQLTPEQTETPDAAATAFLVKAFEAFLWRAQRAADGSGNGTVSFDEFDTFYLPTRQLTEKTPLPTRPAAAYTDHVDYADCPHADVVRRLLDGEHPNDIGGTARQRRRFRTKQLPAIRAYVERCL